MAASLALAGCEQAADDTAEPGSLRAAVMGTDPIPFAPERVADLGFDPDALLALATHAEEENSTCFLVAREGQIVGEWYWRETDPDSTQEVFSAAKSVTGALVGIAEHDGDLALTDRASRYIPQWRGTASAKVTVRNLMSNDSGRFWSTKSDYTTLLHAKDRTGYAVGLKQQAKPGKVWAYNNAAIQTLDRVIVTATGVETAEFAEDRLFDPLGMTRSRMTPDAAQASTNVYFGLQSTCRDLARFGQFFAQDGEWEGEQLLAPEFVAASTAESSQKLNAAYGLLWWVNQAGPQRSPVDADNPGLPPGVDGVGQLAPGAPEDLYAALGYGGQVVLIDPSSQTVVVRLGAPGVRESFGYGFADGAEVITDALDTLG